MIARSEFGSAAALIRRVAGVLAALLLIVSAVPAAPQPPTTGGADAAATTAIPAARQARNVGIITIEGEINAIMAKSVARRMEEFQRDGADALVFQINTPGGELGAALEISRMIKRSPIPNTVAWVNPTAYSAGAIIALACREIVVTDHAVLGDAAILMMSFGGLVKGVPETERQKILAPLLVDVVESARLRGHDERLVQAFVSRGVDLILIRNTITGEQMFVGKDEYRAIFGKPPPVMAPTAPAAAGGVPYAQETGGLPADEQAGGRFGQPLPSSAPPTTGQPQDGTEYVPAIPNLPREVVAEVTAQLEDRSSRPVITPETRDQWVLVENVASGEGILTLTSKELVRYRLAAETIRNDEELRTFFGAENVARLHQSWSERMVVVLTHWMVRGVLIVIFLVALFIEMTHPGLILPGSVAALALVMLVAPPFLNNMASWWEVVAIAAGIMLIALEIFVLPGFGIFGMLGILLLFGGLLGTFATNSGGLFPDSPKGRQDLLYGLATLLLSGVTSGILMYFIGKHLGSLPIVGRMVLKDTPPDDAEDDGHGMLEAMAAPVTEGLVIGAEGISLTPLRPAGRIMIGDEVYDVVAEGGFIPQGARVRVASIGAFRTTVEPLTSGGAQA